MKQKKSKNTNLKDLKTINFFFKNERNRTLLLYFIGYLFLLPLVIDIFNQELRIWVRLAGTFLLFVLILRTSKNAFTNVMEDLNEVASNKTLLAGVLAFNIFVINIICSYIKDIFNLTVNNNQLLFIATFKENPFIIGIISILLLPFIEETIFKYQLFHQNQNRFLNRHWILKMLLVAIVFALLHSITTAFSFATAIDFINYLLFFLITCIAYKKTDNLMLPIMIHMVVNLTTLIVYTV